MLTFRFLTYIQLLSTIIPSHHETLCEPEATKAGRTVAWVASRSHVRYALVSLYHSAGYVSRRKIAYWLLTGIFNLQMEATSSLFSHKADPTALIIYFTIKQMHQADL